MHIYVYDNREEKARDLRSEGVSVAWEELGKGKEKEENGVIIFKLKSMLAKQSDFIALFSCVVHILIHF